MLTTVVRPQPVTAADWHSAIGPHVGHDLIVYSDYSRNRAVAHNATADGRVDLTIWQDTFPAPVPTDDSGNWRPNVSMRLFFGTRKVGCRTCQTPIAR